MSEALRKGGAGGRGRLARWLAPLVLLSAAGFAHHRCFDAPFLLDDEKAIDQNESLGPPFDLGSALSPPQDTTVAGRPLLNLSFALDRTRGGLEPSTFHGTNLAIHLLATLLLYGLARRTLASPRLSPALRKDADVLGLGIALLWSVHPLTTQAITYLAQRAESLVSLFLLATLYASVRAAGARRALPWGAAAVAASALGMATKEVMVAAPLLVVVHDLMFLEGTAKEVARRRAGLWLALAATWGVLVALVLGSPRSASVGTELGVGSFDYLATQVGVLVHYLRLAVWPSPLVFDYDWPIVEGLGPALLPGLAIVLLGLGTVWAVSRRRPIGFLGALFFLVLGPSSSVLPIVSEVAAEHRMYLPLVAVIAFVVLALHGLAATRIASWRRVGPIAGLLLAVVLGMATLRRDSAYGNAITLWEGVLENDPRNARAHLSLGVHLLREGRLEEARSHCAEADRLGADPYEVAANLGLVLLRLELFDEAADALRRAVELQPGELAPLANLGIALARAGRFREAVGPLREALALDEDRAVLHDHMAEALASSGSLEEAVEHLRRACDLDPLRADWHGKLGRGLRIIGRTAEALVELRQASRLDPNSPVRIDLAWLLATCPDDSLRDGEEAVSHGQALVDAEMEPREEVLHVLGAAQAEAGLFTSAITTVERAIALAEERGRTRRADAFRAALEQYREGRPLRE